MEIICLTPRRPGRHHRPDQGGAHRPGGCRVGGLPDDHHGGGVFFKGGQGLPWKNGGKVGENWWKSWGKTMVNTSHVSGKLMGFELGCNSPG